MSFKSVSSTERRWWSETPDKCESAKQLCSNTTLQDERNPYLEKVSEAWRLACQSRSERFLFTQLRGCFSSYWVQLSPIWALISSIAPLFYHHSEKNLTQVLNSSFQDYETYKRLSQNYREELSWWITNMNKWNGKALLNRSDWKLNPRR